MNHEVPVDLNPYSTRFRTGFTWPGTSGRIPAELRAFGWTPRRRRDLLAGGGAGSPCAA
jgi:hypothetical protein